MHLPVKPRLAVAALATLLPLAAAAADIDSVGNLTQSQFRLFSEDLGAALSFKPLIPAEPLGITGTDLKNARLLSLASSGRSVPTLLPVPTLRAHKGLPLNIDIGAMYSKIPDLDVTLWGGELRWAIVEGGALMPAVALRGSYSALTGVDQLKLTTAGADISISKGFAMFTPYAGVGQVWVKSTPQGVPVLREESFTQTKVFAGVNINLGINLALEADTTGGIVSYGAKFGVRF
jgi:hypothetical protein